MIRKVLGQRVKDLRIKKGVSRRELKEKTNFSTATIIYMEEGKRNYSVDKLEELVIALGEDPKEFLK